MSSGALCAVNGCRSSRRRDKHLTFFHLPTNEERRKTWAELIGRPDLARPETKPKSYYVCCLHFEESFIIHKPQLLPDALPTKLLPSKQTTSSASTEPEYKDVSTQTKFANIKKLSATYKTADTKLESVQTSHNNQNEATQTSTAPLSNTRRKRRLSDDLNVSKLKIQKVRNDLGKIKQEVKSKESQSFELSTSQTDDEDTKRFCKLIQSQSNLKSNHAGNRYDPEFKLFALNFNFFNPQTYRRMKNFLGLPSQSTLERFKMVLTPKFEDRTLEFLSSKLKSMPSNVKYCTLSLHETVLKRHLHYDTRRDEIIGLHNINVEVTSELASHACVIILSSIAVNWKQPIAYSFIGSPKLYDKLEQWLDEAILNLSDIGIEVEAIESDLGSNFDNYTKQVKKVTAEKPYFLLNGRKIYYKYSMSHISLNASGKLTGK